MEFEQRVAVMLRERADDIPDRPAPELSSARAPVEIAPAASERSRAWLVAAVVAVLASAGGVALLLRDDDQRVETGPIDTPSTAATSPAPDDPGVQLDITVRQRQSSTHAQGSLAVMEITDAAGARVGDLQVAPAFRLYDPEAEPGSTGSDMVTSFLDDHFEIRPGQYTISVWQYLCSEEGCPDELPADVLDADRVDECTGELAVTEDEGASLMMVFTPGHGCDYVGAAREEDLQAADELLQRQIANGWVPYGGRPAMPNYVVPFFRDAWIPAGLGGDPACKRPPEIPDPVNMQCIRDAPDGNLIGYHIGQLGYVPLDRLDEFDINQAYVDYQGCSPLLDETCEVRQRLESMRQMLDRGDLDAEQRELFERQVEELEQQLAELEAGPTTTQP
jgi:hypothetical protein